MDKIYILQSDSLPGICKVGFTSGKPSRRCAQIVAQHIDFFSLHDQFKVKYQIGVSRGQKCEADIHRLLRRNMLPTGKRSELFLIDLESCISIVTSVARRYKPRLMLQCDGRIVEKQHNKSGNDKARKMTYDQKLKLAESSILAGNVKPKAREISMLCACAYRTSLCILNELVDQGVITKVGRNFQSNLAANSSADGS